VPAGDPNAPEQPASRLLSDGHLRQISFVSRHSGCGTCGRTRSALVTGGSAGGRWLSRRGRGGDGLLNRSAQGAGLPAVVRRPAEYVHSRGWPRDRCSTPSSTVVRRAANVLEPCSGGVQALPTLRVRCPHCSAVTSTGLSPRCALGAPASPRRLRVGTARTGLTTQRNLRCPVVPDRAHSSGDCRPGLMHHLAQLPTGPAL